MSHWLFFTILAPTCWAFCNVLDTAVRRYYVKNDFTNMWLLTVARIPIIFLFLLWMPHSWPEGITILVMLWAGALWVLPFMFYYRTVEFEDPSRTALFLQMSGVFVLPIAFLLIGEQLTLQQLVAFFIILSGGMIAGLKRLSGIWSLSKAFWFIALASIGWSISDVLFKKFAGEFEHYTSAFIIYLLGGLLCGLFFLLSKKIRRLIHDNLRNISRRGWIIISVNLLMGLTGTLAFSYALTLGKASLTTVFLGIQPLLAFLWGFPLTLWLWEVHQEDTSLGTLWMKAISLSFIVFGLFLL